MGYLRRGRRIDSQRDMRKTPRLPAPLSQSLGVRRSARLSRLIRHTGLPPETLLDIALEVLERLASRLPCRSGDAQSQPGLATARWKRISPGERFAVLRAVVSE